MPRLSAGLLMYRIKDGAIQVLLAHPGGPYYAKKDDESWSIPKGEPGPDEDLFLTAQREFEEETSLKPTGPCVPLQPVKQKGGKFVHAWAFEGDCDPTAIKSNTFTMEWPPKSGEQKQFPEIDRAEFFDLATARRKVKAAQVGLIDELEMILNRK
jgi:predicted NUDIX family NTP pyrophosphohydrolase